MIIKTSGLLLFKWNIIHKYKLKLEFVAVFKYLIHHTGFQSQIIIDGITNRSVYPVLIKYRVVCTQEYFIIGRKIKHILLNCLLIDRDIQRQEVPEAHAEFRFDETLFYSVTMLNEYAAKVLACDKLLIQSVFSPAGLLVSTGNIWLGIN